MTVEKLLIGLINVFFQIIKNDYFGSTQNRKRFYHIVNKITTQTQFECIYKSTLHRGYDIDVIKWIQEEKLNRTLARKLLQKSNRYLINFIVKPLIMHFYQPVRAINSYEIVFVRKSVWQSFQNKAFNELITEGHLQLCETRMLNKSRGMLRIMPKLSCQDLNYRTYVSLSKKEYCVSKDYLKKLAKIINKIANNISKTRKISLFNYWKNYTEHVSSEPLYGIKIDIQDAFGRVNIYVLQKLIEKYNVFFLNKDKLFILNHIENQYVVYRRKLYKWNHGLLQGDPLSSSLCNLYITCVETRLLSEFIQPHIFFYRFVDDYFFCSPKLEDVHNFERKLLNILVINESKTERVFLNNDNFKLTFCGQIFDLSTREVSRFYDFKTNKPSIRYKCKLWNINTPIPENSKYEIILKTLDFKNNNYCFKAMELNTFFNTEEKVLYNYFEGMIFIAYKFDYVVKSLVDYGNIITNNTQLLESVNNLISGYARICLKKIKKYAGKLFSGNINLKLLLKIGFKAFVLVLRRAHTFYKQLIEGIKLGKLFLNLEHFKIKPSVFARLPLQLRDIAIHRKSNI